MAMDVSTLAVEVKSSGIASTATKLDKLATSSDKAEASAKKATDQINKLIGSMDSLAKMQGTATSAAAAHIQSIQNGTTQLAAMGKSATSVNKTLQELNHTATQTGNAFGHAHNKGNILNNTLKSMMVAMSAYLGISFAKGILEAGDAWAMMQAKLKIATGSMHNALVVQEGLFDLSQKMRAPLDDMGKLYVRLAEPLRKMGKSSKDTMEMVEGVSLALKLQGATAAEASSTMLQFSQAANAGRLNGAEFNSVSENGTLILKALEDSLGKNRAELKKMGSEGKLTFDLINDALQKKLPQWRKDFESLPLTVDGAVQRIKNAWLKAMGEMSQESGLNKGLSESLLVVEKLIPVIRDEMAAAFIGIGKWVGENKSMLADTWLQVKGIVGDVWSLVSAFNYATGAATGMAGEFSLFGFALFSARLAIAGIQDGFTLIGAVVLKVGAAITKAIVEPLGVMAIGAVQKLIEAFSFLTNLWAKGFDLVGLTAIADGLRSVSNFAGDVSSSLDASMDSVKGWSSTMSDAADKAFASLASGDSAVQKVLKGEEQITVAVKTRSAYEEAAGKARKTQSEEDEKSLKKLEKLQKAANDELEKSLVSYKEAARSLVELEAHGLAGDKRTAAQKEQIKLEHDLSKATDKVVIAKLKDALATNKATQEVEHHESVLRDVLKADKDRLDSINKSIEKTLEEAQSNEDLVAAFGKSKGAIEELEIARLEEQLAQKTSIGLCNAETAALDELIQAKKRNATARTQLGVLETEKKATEEIQKDWEKTVDKIDDVFRNGFADMLNNGKSAWKSFTKSLATTFKTVVAEAIYKTFAQKFVVNMAANLLGVFGMGGAANAAASSAGGSAVGSAAGSMLGGIGASMGAFGTGAGYGAASLFANGLSGTLSAGSAMMGAGNIASGLGTIAGALGPILIGVALLASLVKKSTPHMGGASSYNAQTGLSTISGGSLGTAPGMRFDATAQKLTGDLAKTVVTILDSTATAFGKEAGYQAATAFADDSSKDGAWGALVIEKMGNTILDWRDTQTSRWAPKEFANGEEGSKQYLSAIAASTLDALNQIGLPEWASNYLKALGDGPTLEQLAGAVDQINAGKLALVQMGNNLVGFSNLTDAAVSALVKASGGMEALAASANSFYEGYYSESEKVANTSKQVAEALAAVGIAMPATREEYRAQVEAQMALGESAATATATLLKNATAFGIVADYSKRMTDEVIDGVSKNTAERDLETYSRNVEEAVSLLSEAYSREADVLKATIEKHKEYAKTLRAFRDSLLVGTLSNISPEAKYLELKNRFELTSSRAIAGDETAISELQGISQQFLEASQGYFASSEGYTRDFNAVRSALEAAAQYSDAQVSLESQQLTFLQESVQGLVSIDTSVMSVYQAIMNLATVMSTRVGGQGGTLSGSASKAVVNSLYGNMLGRAPEAGATDFWTNQITQQGVGSVAAAIALSPEAKSVTNTVSGLYQSLLGRAPEAGAVDFWNQQMSNGMSFEDVRKSFVNSDEFIGMHGSHANGLERVPFNGYRALLHKDERVQTAAQARDSDESAELLRQVLIELKAANTQRGAATEEQLMAQRLLAEKLDSQKRAIAANNAN